MSLAFIERLGVVKPDIYLPHRAYVEIAATIGRMHGDPALGISLADAIVALPFVKWMTLDRRLARLSASMATDHRLRGADAVYAAVAAAKGCDLVSLDGEHLNPIDRRCTDLHPRPSPRPTVTL